MHGTEMKNPDATLAQSFAELSVVIGEIEDALGIVLLPTEPGEKIEMDKITLAIVALNRLRCRTTTIREVVAKIA